MVCVVRIWFSVGGVGCLLRDSKMLVPGLCILFCPLDCIGFAIPIRGCVFLEAGGLCVDCACMCECEGNVVLIVHPFFH